MPSWFYFISCRRTGDVDVYLLLLSIIEALEETFCEISISRLKASLYWRWNEKKEKINVKVWHTFPALGGEDELTKVGEVRGQVAVLCWRSKMKERLCENGWNFFLAAVVASSSLHIVDGIPFWSKLGDFRNATRKLESDIKRVSTRVEEEHQT